MTHLSITIQSLNDFNCHQLISKNIKGFVYFFKYPIVLHLNYHWLILFSIQNLHICIPMRASCETIATSFKNVSFYPIPSNCIVIKYRLRKFIAHILLRLKSANILLLMWYEVIHLSFFLEIRMKSSHFVS